MMNRFAKMAAVVLSVVLLAGLATAVRADIVAHYTFDTNYNDSSANGLNGVPTDGSGDSDTSGVSIATAAGEYVFGGGAVSFADERDYVDIPTLTYGSGNPYTVSFWAKRNGTSTWDMVIGQPDGSSFFIALNNGGNGLRWRSSDSSSGRQADFAFSNDTDWHHYVLVAGDFEDADTAVDEIRLYRDNVLIGTDDGNSTGFIFDAIGEAYLNTSNFDMYGLVDEVWIFNEALDAHAVDLLYSTNSPVPEPSTVALLAGLGLSGIAVAALRRRRGR